MNASKRRAAELLASATPCWRQCGITVLDADDLAAALDEAWEAGRAFAAREARKYAPVASAEYLEQQVLMAPRPDDV